MWAWSLSIVFLIGPNISGPFTGTEPRFCRHVGLSIRYLACKFYCNWSELGRVMNVFVYIPWSHDSMVI